jgi:hypothetical protein
VTGVSKNDTKEDRPRPPLLYDHLNRPLTPSTTESRDPDLESQKGPKAESDRYRPFRERLSFAITLIGVPLAIYGLWGTSHVLALWAATAIILCGIILYPSGPLPTIMGSSALLLAAVCVYIWWLPPLETEQHGWLRPGSKPAPPIFCSDSKGLAVYLGRSRFGLTTGESSACIVRMAGIDLLTLLRNADSVGISARFFDATGLIAEIVDNEFTVNPNNTFKTERPDASTLIVRDRWGNEAVRVEYLNREAVRITGVFFVPDRKPIIVKTDEIFDTGSGNRTNICAEGFGGEGSCVMVKI